MRPALLSDPAAMADRALGFWHSADPKTLVAGASWYPVIAGRACAIAPSNTADETLSAMAVLSPRITVAQNLIDLETVVTGRPWITSAFPANVERARRLLAGEPFDSVVGPAPKVRAFRANLLGDPEAVTVDTWMVTVLLGLKLGERDQHVPTVAQYKRLAAILRDAARSVNAEPRTFQATVWIAARGKVAE
jgi:hypothetical protein